MSRVWGRSGKAWRSAILARIVQAEGSESSTHYRVYYKQSRGLLGAVARRVADPWAAATTDRYGRSTLIALPVKFPAPSREAVEARKAWETKAYGPELFEFEGLRAKDWFDRVISYLEYRRTHFQKEHKPTYGEFSGFNPYSKAILETVCAFNRADFVPRELVCAAELSNSRLAVIA